MSLRQRAARRAVLRHGPGGDAAAEIVRHLVPLVERAIAAHRQGAMETAERLCLDVLELAPDRPGALTVLYQIRKDAGEPHGGGGADPPDRGAGSEQFRRDQ